MKIFRMIMALLIASLGAGSNICARKAGAGARAGLPDLNKLFNIDRNDEEEISLDKNVIQKVSEAYLNTNDANTRRKLISAFQVYAQKQTLGQNIYNIDLEETDDDKLTKKINDDADDIGEKVAETINEANEAIDKAKNIKQLGSNENANEAFVEAMLSGIAKKIILRQFNEWKQKNPKVAATAMNAYIKKLDD